MSSFYERPILNSPYRAPELHHPLDKNGQPIEGEPRHGRRPSRLIVPVPASRKKAAAAQGSLELETYTDHALINEIRGYLDSWRGLRNPADWGVTWATRGCSNIGATIDSTRSSRSSARSKRSKPSYG